MLIRAAGCAILADLHGEWSWTSRLKNQASFRTWSISRITSKPVTVGFICSLRCRLFYFPNCAPIYCEEVFGELEFNGSQDRLDPAGAEGTCQFPVDAHLGNLSGIWSKLRHRQPHSPPAQLCSAKFKFHGVVWRVLQKRSAAAGGCVREARRRRRQGKCPEEGLIVAVLLLSGLGGRKLLALGLVSADRQSERIRGGPPVFTLRRARVEREQPQTAIYPCASPYSPATLSQHATT